MQNTTSRTELQDGLDAITASMASLHEGMAAIPYPAAWERFCDGRAVEYPDFFELDTAMGALEHARVRLFRALNQS